jgi:predicted LPLAT superfamily acyltransferase
MSFSNYTTDQKKNSWNTEEEKGSPWALTFVIWFSKLFGYNCTYRLTYFIVWFYFLVDAPKRRVVIAYLQQLHFYAKEKTPFTEEPGFWHGFKLYKFFGEVIVDRFVSWMRAEKDFFEVDWNGKELLEAQIQSGRGALLLSGHLGNIEVLRSIAQVKDVPIKMLMFVRNAQKYLNMLSKSNKQVLDHLICLESMGIGALTLLQEEIEQGQLIGVLADRITQGAPEKTIQVPWLGRLASFPQGPFVLATLLEVPIYTFFVIKTGSRKYRVEVSQIFDGRTTQRKNRKEVIKNILLAYKEQLETFCLLYPYQWFNFYDFWKA